jgi:hypothetical protein
MNNKLILRIIFNKDLAFYLIIISRNIIFLCILRVLYLNHEACLYNNDKWLTRLKGRLQVLTTVKQLIHLPHIGQIK